MQKRQYLRERINYSINFVRRINHLEKEQLNIQLTLPFPEIDFRWWKDLNVNQSNDKKILGLKGKYYKICTIDKNQKLKL